MDKAERSIVVSVPQGRLYDVIVDFGRYPEFLAEIKKSSVISQDETSARVEFEASLAGKSIPYTLRFTMARPSSVRWTLESSSFLKANDGEWDLRPHGDNATHATYRLGIKVGMFVPAFVTTALAGKSLPSVLEAFKARAERGS